MAKHNNQPNDGVDIRRLGSIFRNLGVGTDLSDVVTVEYTV